MTRRLRAAAVIAFAFCLIAPVPAFARSRPARRAAPRRPTHLAVPLVSRVSTRDPVVFITIDDGWVRDRSVVDIIRREHIPVTAFLVQRAAAKDLAYFKDVISEGGTVEDHTFDHPFLSRQSFARQSGEICSPLDWYAQSFGRRPALLRPPYGNFNAATGDVAHSCGLAAVVLWSVEVRGTRVMTSGGGLRAGDIVLLHFRKDLAAGLNVIVARAHRAGLGFGRLPEYLAPQQSPPPDQPAPKDPPPPPPPSDPPPDDHPPGSPPPPLP